MPGKTSVERVEVDLAKAAAPLRETAAVRALGAVSEIADQPPLIALCAATLAAGAATGNRRLAEAGARMLTAELIGIVLKNAIKHRVDRTRPHVVADGGAYERRRGSDHDSARNSFPSGHTAGAVAVARALVRDYPEHRAAAYGAAAAVAAIQMPRSKHYPTDVAAGTAIGIAAEALAYGAERLLVRVMRRGVRPESLTHH